MGKFSSWIYRGELEAWVQGASLALRQTWRLDLQEAGLYAELWLCPGD